MLVGNSLVLVFPVMLDLLNNWLALPVWSAWLLIKLNCKWAQPCYWQWKFSHLFSWSGWATLWQISCPNISCQVPGKGHCKASSEDQMNGKGRALPEGERLMAWLSCPCRVHFRWNAEVSQACGCKRKGSLGKGTRKGIIICPLELQPLVVSPSLNSRAVGNDHHSSRVQ